MVEKRRSRTAPLPAMEGKSPAVQREYENDNVKLCLAKARRMGI